MWYADISTSVCFDQQVGTVHQLRLLTPFGVVHSLYRKATSGEQREVFSLPRTKV